MKRLWLIIACHLIVYCNFAICDFFYPGDDKDSVNWFDLLKHSFYYLLAFCCIIKERFQKVEPYEKWVIFLEVVLIYGVFINCVLFNFEGDRDFHWYSIPIVLLSVGHGIKKAWPDRYARIVSRIPGYNRAVKIYKWICHPTK